MGRAVAATAIRRSELRKQHLPLQAILERKRRSGSDVFPSERLEVAGIEPAS